MKKTDPLHWAICVGEGLLRRATRDKTGLKWLTFDVETRKDVGYPWDLYSGSTGIGFFLTLLGQKSKKKRFIEAGELALKRSYRCGQRTFMPHGLAGFAGVGQAFLLLGKLKAACRVAEYLSYIPDSEQYEVLYGSAGIGSFFLSLYRATGQQEYLDAAKKRGDRIVNAATPWRFHNKNFVGYAHGAAGVAEFMIFLYSETGDKTYSKCVRRLTSFVRRHTIHDGESCHTKKAVGHDRYQAAWCHGTPGTILFEIAGANVFRAESWRTAANKKAATTFNQIINGEIGLLCYCHGLAGNLDMLVSYGLVDEAKKCSEALVLPQALRHKGRKKTLSFPAQGGNEALPGLFLGDAGIGFHFLRLAFPEIGLPYRVN